MKRHTYLIRLALILVFQAAMVVSMVYFDSSPHEWLLNWFGSAALLVPFVGYMVAAYQTPLFRKWAPTLKAGFITLCSVIFTISGYAVLFLGGLWIKGEMEIGRSSLSSVPDVCVCGVTNWARFSSDDRGFSVLMPFKPAIKTVTNETAAGPLVISVFTAESSQVVAFSVVHNRFSTNMDISKKEKLFEGGLKSALGADGRLLSEAEIRLHGYPGREWNFEKYKGQALFTMRIYLVNQELYQSICVMPKKRACSRHCREFLASFDINERGSTVVSQRDAEGLMGRIRCGMTVAEIKRAIPHSTVSSFSGEHGGVWYDMAISDDFIIQYRAAHPHDGQTAEQSVINYSPRLRDRHTLVFISGEEKSW